MPAGVGPMEHTALAIKYFHKKKKKKLYETKGIELATSRENCVSQTDFIRRKQQSQEKQKKCGRACRLTTTKGE